VSARVAARRLRALGAVKKKCKEKEKSRRRRRKKKKVSWLAAVARG